MPLRAHLAELRSRLLKAAAAIVLGAVLGWFLYDPLFNALMKPLLEIGKERGVFTSANFNGVATSFNLKLQMSVYLGIIVASPVWLYQLWAFIVPGLTRKEKRTALAFVAVAVPLFLSGFYVAWLVFPNAIRFLTEFVPTGATNIIDVAEYLTFVTKLFLAFGIAFLLPLFLVALNLAGVLSAVTMARGWRIAVFLVFLFAALASPTPDAGSMLALAFPMVGLYLVAVGFAFLNDRRKRRKDPFAGLSDDEASPLGPADDLDLSPSSLDELRDGDGRSADGRGEKVHSGYSSSGAGEASDGAYGGSRGPYDDVT